MSVRFTGEVGYKFHADGSVRAFPGNTIICFVDRQQHAQVFQACVWAQDQLKQMQCASALAFLPPDSFHMTVIQLICDQVRRPQKWSSFLSLEAPLLETDQFFIERVKQVPAPSSLRMKYESVRETTVGLELAAADSATAEALQTYRDQIAEKTGVRFPDHDTYKFHISLAYRVLQLSAEQEEEIHATFARIDTHLKKSFGIFETNAPQLVFFDDMFKFVPESERHQLVSRNQA